MHIGSQISDLNAFRQTFENLAKLLYELKKIKIHVENIDIGGGLGIKYTDSDMEPDLQEYCSMVRQILGNLYSRKFWYFGNSGSL